MQKFMKTKKEMLSRWLIKKMQLFYIKFKNGIHKNKLYQLPANNTKPLVQPDLIDPVHKKLLKTDFRLRLLLFILLFSGITMLLIQKNSEHQAALQTDIAQNIIRFHVIANSDSEKDQALKLKVKEALVDSLSPILSNTSTITEAREVLSGQLDQIQDIAEGTLLQNGCNNPVTVTLESCYFPLKIYGGYSFPPGNYESLRVKIGKAQGQNWWCVMFPPLCFVDETYAIVDEDSKKQLKHLLTEEEYDTLINQKTPVKIKFKLLEEIKKLFE